MAWILNDRAVPGTAPHEPTPALLDRDPSLGSSPHTSHTSHGCDDDASWELVSRLRSVLQACRGRSIALVNATLTAPKGVAVGPLAARFAETLGSRADTGALLAVDIALERREHLHGPVLVDSTCGGTNRADGSERKRLLLNGAR